MEAGVAELHVKVGRENKSEKGYGAGSNQVQNASEARNSFGDKKQRQNA